MTPKDKAKELVELYCQLLSIRSYEDKDKAKQCALIAVEEILNNYEEQYKYCKTKIYWEEVKTEINKL